jgi:ribonuclease BN (tRNA processing enzyme)
MKIKTLGCHGGQLPGYNNAGYLVDGNMLLDAGTIASKLSIQEQRRIRTIFITHAHLDHIGGLPFFAVNITSNKAPSVEIASTKANLNAISRHLMSGALWPDFTRIKNFGGNPVYKYTEMSRNRWHKIGGFNVKPVQVRHTVPADGLIFGKNGRYAVYTGDTKQTSSLWAEARKLGKKLKAVMIEVAYPNALSGLAEASGHLVPKTAELELKKLGSLRPKVFAIHMKPEYISKLKKELKAVKGFKVTMMQEGKTYKI